MSHAVNERTWIAFSNRLGLKSQINILNVFGDDVRIFNNRICISFFDYFNKYRELPSWVIKYNIVEYNPATDSCNNIWIPLSESPWKQSHPLLPIHTYNPIKKTIYSKTDTHCFMRSLDNIMTLRLGRIESRFSSNTEDDYIIDTLTRRGYL